jgi:Protein of unknown function DUF2617
MQGDDGMSVSYHRSHVADLAFQVFGRVIQPDWFAVRGHRRITQPDWEADIRLIDGGHAIHWRSGQSRLTEVLCGPETILPEPGLLYHSPVRHERTATLRQGDRAEYQTCFDVERIDIELFKHLCDEILVDARKGLLHRYVTGSRIDPTPLSQIRIDARPLGLSVQAFHTFPEERAIVRTQSLFEILPSTAS